MMVVAMPVVMAPIPLTINFFRQCSPFFASQRRTIPAWDKVKDTKTPMAYSGMRAWVSPWKITSSRQAKNPKIMMPLENTRRSPNVAIWWGINPSRAKNRCQMRKAGKGAVGRQHQQHHGSHLDHVIDKTGPEGQAGQIETTVSSSFGMMP